MENIFRHHVMEFRQSLLEYQCVISIVIMESVRLRITRILCGLQLKL